MSSDALQSNPAPDAGYIALRYDDVGLLRIK